jgi:hypothetical protein
VGKIFLDRYSHKGSLEILDHCFKLAKLVGWALPTSLNRGRLNRLFQQWRDDDRCNNDDIDYYEAHADWGLITEYLDKKAPGKPDRHRFSIPEWAQQAGVFLRDGILWIPKVIGLVLIGVLTALARSFGIPTRVY